MRSDLKIIITTALAGVIAISSCSKKIDEAYKNPNAAVRQPVEVIFPSMIGTIIGNSNAATNSFGLAGDGINIGRYIQNWGSYVNTTTENSGTQYDRMGGTTAGSDAMGNMWGCHYFSMGYNLNRIIEWGSEEQKWDFVGAAWALRAWSMFSTTNQYGEIILRQAFNTSLLQFNYEEQPEVYDSVRTICHRALSYLNMTGGGMDPVKFASSDFYFNKGDLNLWKKFVYGILARSYAYLSNKSIYSADSVIKYANLSCNTNADNITCKFQNTLVTGTSNFFGSARGNVNNASTGLRQTAFIANLMTGANSFAFSGVNDPRAWYLLRENRASTIKGIAKPFSGVNSLPFNDEPQSFVGTYVTYSTASPYPATPSGSGGYLSPEQGRYIFRNDAEFPIMTASEMQFLKAEAALRQGNYNTAKTAYENGIGLNIDMLMIKYNANVPLAQQLDGTKKANYLADPAIVPAAAGSMTLTRIMLQKYIALYGWGIYETWADMRRFHYTDLDPATGNAVYAGLPVLLDTELFSGVNGTGSNNKKFVYRTRPRYNSEYLYNIPALTAIGAYPPGNDYHTKKMWFSEP